MPNWCMNTVVLKHTKEKIDQLEHHLINNSEAGFFNFLCPRPPEQNENWYAWNIENWGTKSDANISTPADLHHDIERIDDETLQVRFDTAWSPPIAFYDFLFEEGWDVTAKYHEPGMCFIGEYDNTIDDSWEYNLSDESTIEAIPAELREWSSLDDEVKWYKENNDDNY